MTAGSLIQMRSAGFRVAGQGRGQGLVLLYQDKLARVSWRARVLGYLLGPPVLVGIADPFVHAIGAGAAAAGALAGGWMGELVDRRMAARRVVKAAGGVTVIPLDSITSVRTRPGGLLGGRSLVVTTQDGTEYRFYGRLDTWQADLATALTVRGRSVQVTPEGIMVTPPAAEDRQPDREAPWNPA
jgi:hypothetical protein